ncbi:MAG: hypothetical protein U9M98_03755 [Patescibacteria group bacterium]|nr:hypothetical protein [Patescibacteria group bacterium]
MKNWNKLNKNQRESTIYRRKSVSNLRKFFWLLLVICGAFTFLVGQRDGAGVRAYSEMTGSSFKIKDSALDSGGGVSDSASYKMNQAVGQEFQGKKTGSNYNIYEGIMYYPGSITLVCGSSVSIPEVTAGTPQHETDTCTITTESANGYSLYTSKNHNLEHNNDAGTYIEPTSLGSYSSPEPWDTGTDVGLGLSLNGTSAEPKWADGSNFTSIINGTAEVINNYSSAVAQGTNLIMIYQLDVTATQKSGEYSNEVYHYVTTNWF